MAGNEMTRDEIRAALIAKIDAAYPEYKNNPRLAKAVQTASSANLRKHLAFAEFMRDVDPEDPIPYEGPSPRFSNEAEQTVWRILTTVTGNGYPPHSYVLAQDECKGHYDGPSWVPFNLWSRYKYEYGSPLIKECAERLIYSPDAREVWKAIAEKYDRPDNIAANLAVVCADIKANWQSIPRKGPGEFKEGRAELGRRAKQLAVELERFYLHRDPDEHEWPGLLGFTQLMTAEERDRLDQAIRRMTGLIVNRARVDAGIRELDWDEYNDDHNGEAYSHARTDARLIYSLLVPDHTIPNSRSYNYGGVPTLPETLRRIGAAFIADGIEPPLKRPNYDNAERNFFAQRLCKYFWSTGDISPGLVARIVSMFYAQGITDNEVSQMIGKVKRDNPLSADPETSPDK